MRDKTCILINPGSSRADSAPSLKLAARLREGVGCFETDGPDDLRHRIEDAVRRGVSRIVVAGGDGTIHLAVNALMSLGKQHKNDTLPVVTLGIIPLGTANDLAKSLGLPLAPERAFETAVGESTRAIDVLRLTQSEDGKDTTRYAINAITGGLSVHVHEKLDDDIKQWWGGFAYAKAMFEVVGDAPDHRVTLDTDDREVCGEAFGLVVANGPRAGGQELVPPAKLDDGLAEVLLAQAPQGGERLKLLAEFAVGKHLDSPRVQHCQARQLWITAQPAMPLIADGERCGQTPVTIEVLPGAIHVAVPGNG